MTRGEFKLIKRLLDEGTDAQRAEVFAYLRTRCQIHPLESKLGVPAEIILEAMDRGSDLTMRGVKGMIAELSFKTHVLDRLPRWKCGPLVGDYSYDFLIEDAAGSVRLQVKMQRSDRKVPSRYKSGMFKVEVQRTRGGVGRLTNEKTRPYRFEDFDILAVSMQASTGSWESFLYTVTRWLIPNDADPRIIRTFQPVATKCNDDWTDDLEVAISWFRSRVKKTISLE